MKLPAPAKVNLHLRVVGRRSDGFHDIETLMVPLSFGDTLEIDLAPDFSLTCPDPGPPSGNDNLVLKAARLFFAESGHPGGARIHLEKQIPMGAGLAGGSSDAATILLALNELLESPFDAARLESLAARLGSDIPFFIRRQAAWCRGRGEQITPFTLPETLSLLLFKPPFSVSTPWAYQHWSTAQPLPGFSDEPQSLGWVDITNSLELPVFQKFWILPVAKKWLREQPETRAAAMSGSGSTLFAILRDPASASALAARFSAAFGDTWWLKSCSTASTFS